MAVPSRAGVLADSCLCGDQDNSRSYIVVHYFVMRGLLTALQAVIPTPLCASDFEWVAVHVVVNEQNCLVHFGIDFCVQLVGLVIDCSDAPNVS